MKNRIEYQPTITFGNILSLIGMLGTLVGLYVTHERRLVVVETRMLPLLSTVEAIAESQKVTTRTLDKLVILNDERARILVPR